MVLTPLLIFLYTSVRCHRQSQSRLYKHRSSNLSIRLLFVPISGWLMAFLLLYTFFPVLGKSKFSYALSEIL